MPKPSNLFRYKSAQKDNLTIIEKILSSDVEKKKIESQTLFELNREGQIRMDRELATRSDLERKHELKMESRRRQSAEDEELSRRQSREDLAATREHELKMLALKNKITE